MALRPVGEGVFDAELNRHWTIGPKLHGGAMLALCAAAAREAYAVSGDSDVRPQPVAVSASFLSAPDPGPVRLRTRVRKRGRRVGVVEAELVQGERTGVHAIVNLGEPEHLVAPLLSDNPVSSLMNPEPPPGVEPIGPGHPMWGTVNYATGVDVRPLMSSVPDGPAAGSSAPLRHSPRIQIWARPRDGAPDALFALLCGDISMPVAFAVGRRGWAPTVQLTAYLRGIPADGWLRVLCTTTLIGQDWFDSDHVVVDCQGRVVVQTRQLAMVPAR